MKILFMSEEHSVKRKLAAHIANHFAEGKAEIFLFRTAFDPTDYLLDTVLGEVEIPKVDDNIQRAQNLNNEEYDIVIMLCKCFRRRMLNFSGFPAKLYWPLDNPVQKGSSPNQIQTSLRKMRDDLIVRVRHLFEDGYLDSFQRQINQINDLFDDHSQGVIKFNREEIIISLNEQAKRLTGYDSDVICGKPLHFLIPDDTVSRHALAVTDEGVLFKQTELRLKREDKEIMKIKAIFKALVREKGLGGYISFEESREEPVIQPMEGTRGLDRLSWDRVEASLKQTGGNRTKAARVLGVGRATFYRFLDREKMQGRMPKTELI